MSHHSRSKTRNVRNKYSSPGVSYSISSASDHSVKTDSSLSSPRHAPNTYTPTILNFQRYSPWQWQEPPSDLVTQASARYPDIAAPKHALSPSAFINDWNCYFTSLPYRSAPEHLLPKNEHNSGVTFIGQWAYDTAGKRPNTVPSHGSLKLVTNKKRDRSISAERISSPPNNTRSVQQPSCGSSGLTEAKKAPRTVPSPRTTDIVMKDLSPGPEPGLDSDGTSLDDTPVGPRPLTRDNDLEKLALAVFKFWPEGVSFYLDYSPSSSQSSHFNGSSTPLNNSYGRFQNPGQPLGQSQKIPRSNQDGNADQGAKPLSDIKQKKANGEPVPEWRCLHEAGHGDNSLCCDHCDFTRFDSMLRHLKSHQIDDSGHITLQQRIDELKVIVKQSSNDACELFAASLFNIMYPGRPIPYLRFYRLRNRDRDPFPPPARFVSRQPMLPAGSIRAPSISVEQPTPRPVTPLSSFTVDEARPATDASNSRQHELNRAARAFSADMKREPLLQIQVTEIHARMSATKERVTLRKRKVESQARSKRKELEDEEQQQAGVRRLDERSKRACLEKIDEEEIQELDGLNQEWLQSIANAKAEMQELQSSRITTNTTAATTNNQAGESSMMMMMTRPKTNHHPPPVVVSSIDGPVAVPPVIAPNDADADFLSSFTYMSEN